MKKFFKSKYIPTLVYILLTILCGYALTEISPFIKGFLEYSEDVDKVSNFWNMTFGSAISISGAIVAIYLAMNALKISENQEKLEIQQNINDIRNQIIFDSHKIVMILNKLIIATKTQIGRNDRNLNKINFELISKNILEFSDHLQGIYVNYHTYNFIRKNEENEVDFIELISELSSIELNIKDQKYIENVLVLFNLICKENDSENKAIILISLIIKHELDDNKKNIKHTFLYSIVNLLNSLADKKEEISKYLEKESPSIINDSFNYNNISYDDEGLKKLKNKLTKNKELIEKYESKEKVNTNKLGEFDPNEDTNETVEKDIKNIDNYLKIKEKKVFIDLLLDNEKSFSISHFYKRGSEYFRGETLIPIGSDFKKCLGTFVLFNPNKGTKQITQNGNLVKVDNHILKEVFGLKRENKNYFVSYLDNNTKVLKRIFEGKEGFIRVIYLFDIILTEADSKYAEVSREFIQNNSGNIVNNKIEYDFDTDGDYIFSYGRIMKNVKSIEDRVKSFISEIKSNDKIKKMKDKRIEKFDLYSDLKNPPPQPYYFRNDVETIRQNLN